MPAMVSFDDCNELDLLEELSLRGTTDTGSGDRSSEHGDERSCISSIAMDLSTDLSFLPRPARGDEVTTPQAFLMDVSVMISSRTLPLTTSCRGSLPCTSSLNLSVSEQLV